MSTPIPHQEPLEQPAPPPKVERDNDSLLAAVVTVAGVSIAASAARTNPRAFIMIAGLEGSLALLLVASALGMLGGLRARAMLALLAPIVGLQIAYLSFRSIPWVAPVGAEIAGMGAIGLAGTKVRAWIDGWLRAPEPR